MLEVFRWAVIGEGVFALGTLCAVYQRVWRFALPAVATRAAAAAAAATVAGYLVGLHDRLGEPLSWRDIFACVVLTVYLGALVSLYYWYRMPEGRRLRHSAIAEYNAMRLLRAEEQRQRSERRL